MIADSRNQPADRRPVPQGREILPVKIHNKRYYLPDRQSLENRNNHFVAKYDSKETLVRSIYRGHRRLG